MRFEVVTLFPEFFGAPLATGLLGKAIEAGRVSVHTVDPRAFTQDRHRTVDDTPYGGGGGMVMKPGPVRAAITAARNAGGGPVLLMSPQGRPLAQADLQRWARLPHLVLVAGRYEGFDERIRLVADEEVSLGDFVLTGGEYAALAVIDGVVRLLPGTLGNASSPEEDSFSSGLLEYPHYTRPPDLEGAGVPEVLLSGHHAEIAAWRQARALERTRWRRPDLLARRGFTRAERAILVTAPSAAPPTTLLLITRGSAPEVLATAGAATQLACAYQVAGLVLVIAAEDVRQAVAEALATPGQEDAAAGPRVEVAASVEAWRAVQGPTILVTGAPTPPDVATTAPQVAVARARAERATLALVLGPGLVWAAGKRLEVASFLDGVLPPVRVGAPANDLGLLPAAAILLDRLLGEA